jgi:hypothetical protein
MSGGQELDIGADLDILTDGDARDVEEDRAEVDECPRADVGLVAVVAAQRRPDLSALGEGAEQLAQLTQDGAPRLSVREVAGVEPRAKLGGAQALGRELGIVGDVEVASQHAFALAAPVNGFWRRIAHGRACLLPRFEIHQSAARRPLACSHGEEAPPLLSVAARLWQHGELARG